MPLKVNRFEVKEGHIKYVDENSKPKVDIEMTNTYILAQNLRNSYDSTVLLPARVKASADVYEGNLSFGMKINPLADNPTFDMNAEAKGINLVKLNEFFQAYARIDVNKGTFGLYTEVAAKDGNFDGYVKPIIKDLDVLGKEDRKDNLFQNYGKGLQARSRTYLRISLKTSSQRRFHSEGRLETSMPIYGWQSPPS